MVNEDFSMFMPYSLKEINTWETLFLNKIGFRVRISSSEYAHYYFLLRDILEASGEFTFPMEVMTNTIVFFLSFIYIREHNKLLKWYQNYAIFF